jgi:serine protease Do
VRRGWLGVNIQQVTDELAESFGLGSGARGALVARAQEGGPAAAGGIRAGDVILRFNGQEVREMRNLPRIVADTQVGRQVPVVVWRDGREQTVQITVAELPGEQQQAAHRCPPSDVTTCPHGIPPRTDGWRRRRIRSRAPPWQAAVVP